jgi:HAD superfamily hydrolase (TIGR01509 family)
MLRALIFDVDGTLADTEATHGDAFNEAFAEAALPWFWDVPLYTHLLNVAGGKERILHFWHAADPAAAHGPAAREVVSRLHAAKTRHYERMAAEGRLVLRPGVLHLIEEAAVQGVPMAIATTTTPANINALLRGPLGSGWHRYFAAIGDGGTSPRKKPDPQVYLHVLDALGLPACDCLAFEDSHNGLQAARAAGIATIVTPTVFTAAHDFSGALLVLPHLDGIDLTALRRRHASTTLAPA